MIVPYPCPLPTCTWFYRHVATPGTVNSPTDIVSWTPLNWADMAERTSSGLTAAQIIDAHLATHPPMHWLTLVRSERHRAEDAECTLDRLLNTLEQTADATAAAYPAAPMRLPSRGEVEASAVVLADAMGGGSGNV